MDWYLEKLEEARARVELVEAGFSAVVGEMATPYDAEDIDTISKYCKVIKSARDSVVSADASYQEHLAELNKEKDDVPVQNED